MMAKATPPLHEQAKAYYQRFEFEPLPDSPLTLWLPTAAIAALCGDRAG